ncbi:MAG: 2-isopropylmalate synthase [Acidobacteria bacterium]|nr:2-isopropylmalate synthase [Acidobacteriota bacterium]
MPDRKKLVYDWNRVGAPEPLTRKRIFLNDETLRDGLQSPTVCDPPIEEKFHLVHLMEDLGIHMLDIGLPGAGPRAYNDSLAIASEIAKSRLKIRPNCAARTTIADISPIIEIANKTGIVLDAAMFLGSSLIRQYVENWTIDILLRRTEEAVKYAVDHKMPVMYVTEDTTRAFPETIKSLYSTAINCGARHIVLTDTVGHATPDGARALVQFVIKEIIEPSGAEVTIGWHGHNDRGLSVINSLAAVQAGADVIHGCALGIGERVGNTPMDQVLVNLKLLGVIDNDLVKLKEYCDVASRACKVGIPPGYPVFGSDAFRTATGVHAAAVIKAFKKGDTELANTVYSGVPSHMFGLDQIIDIGPMSGRSNVIFWLEKRGIEPTEERVNAIYNKAKQSDRLLTAEEILEVIGTGPRTQEYLKPGSILP